jgi:hypothetical protein
MQVRSPHRLVRGKPGSVAKGTRAAVDQDLELLGENRGVWRGGWKLRDRHGNRAQFSEMTVAKVSMFEGDCGYRRLLKRSTFSLPWFACRSPEVTGRSLRQKARSAILDSQRLLSEP